MLSNLPHKFPLSYKIDQVTDSIYLLTLTFLGEQSDFQNRQIKFLPVTSWNGSRKTFYFSISIDRIQIVIKAILFLLLIFKYAHCLWKQLLDLNVFSSIILYKQKPEDRLLDFNHLDI